LSPVDPVSASRGRLCLMLLWRFGRRAAYLSISPVAPQLQRAFGVRLLDFMVGGKFRRGPYSARMSLSWPS